jgi:hypothetical protein
MALSKKSVQANLTYAVRDYRQKMSLMLAKGEISANHMKRVSDNLEAVLLFVDAIESEGMEIEEITMYLKAQAQRAMLEKQGKLNFDK